MVELCPFRVCDASVKLNSRYLSDLVRRQKCMPYITTWAHDFTEILYLDSARQTARRSHLEFDSLKLLRERACGVASIRTIYLYAVVRSNAIFLHTNYIQIVKDSHLCTLHAALPSRAPCCWNMHRGARSVRGAVGQGTCTSSMEACRVHILVWLMGILDDLYVVCM